MARTQISFQPGELVEVALQFAKGKRYGERALFSTTDERVFYVDEPVAVRIEAEIQKGERFRLGFNRIAGEKQWKVEKVAAPGLNGAALAVQAAAPEPLEKLRHSNGPMTAPTTAPMTAQARLLGALCVAVDAAVEAQEYARKQGLAIVFTGEDVRCFANALCISLDRRSL
jgi:hypothetical protein